MAPLKPVKKDNADKRVQLVLDFATPTAQLLKDRAPISTNTVSELERLVHQPFPSPNAVAYARKSSDFDTQGSLLWNAATKIIREKDVGDHDTGPKVDLARFGMLLRAFAFFLLDAAHNTSSRRTKDTNQRVRIFRIGLKAVRCSLDNNDLESAHRALEACSKYVSAWDEGTPVIRVSGGDPNDEERMIKKSTSEYYLFRMLHASRSGRPDLAEHFFLKAKVGADVAEHDLSETAAEMCYEIGRSQRQRKHTETAMSWLERAHQLLDSSDDGSSSDHEDLRLAIVASFIEALDDPTNADAMQRAWSLVKSLESDHGLGNRMAVLAMQLNVAMKSGAADIDALAAIVFRMIRSCVLTEQTYRTIMQSISKIKRASFAGALDALDQLITTRLLPDLNAVMETAQVKSWLEKALVMYTNLCATSPENDKPRALEKMPQLLDHMFERTCDLLSPKATHAMQALIWKASNDAQGPEAQVWLSLLQHSIFVTIGATNKARIIRKVMLDALGRDEIETARGSFHQLPLSAQNEGMTRYLAFKLALKSTDSRLASECLKALAKESSKDQRYLYACVLEAQNSGNRPIAVAAFQALANQPSKGTQLPALLRCTAKLLMQELESLSRDLFEVTAEIVRVFEVAATNTGAFRQTTEELWRAEIQWWSKNSFNLAMQLCTEMHPEHLIRLLRACGKFLECYPDDGGLMHRDDLLHRKQICQFLCASALMVLARSATNAEEQLQGYLEVQRESKAFLATWQQPHHSTADAEVQCARAFELIRYNVESVFKLQQWDKLDEALAACLSFRSTARWETLADLVIIIYDQTSNLAIDSSATARIPELLQKIINETWKNEKDTQKLARWLRFTFSIGLDDIDRNMSVKLVEQAASLARRGTEMRNDPYPEDELQWLATTAFNKAVDFLTAGENQATEQWMEAALDLARYAADNGSLHALLTRNREEAEKRMGGK